MLAIALFSVGSIAGCSGQGRTCRPSRLLKSISPARAASITALRLVCAGDGADPSSTDVSLTAIAGGAHPPGFYRLQPVSAFIWPDQERLICSDPYAAVAAAPFQRETGGLGGGLALRCSSTHRAHFVTTTQWRPSISSFYGQATVCLPQSPRFSYKRRRPWRNRRSSMVSCGGPCWPSSKILRPARHRPSLAISPVGVADAVRFSAGHRRILDAAGSATGSLSRPLGACLALRGCW